jgi:hypothetical protein
LVINFVRREHSAQPINLFLSYLYPKQVDRDAIGELQRLGIPCVNFYCDNVREFRRVPEEYRSFALHWVPEFEALEMYRTAGLSHLYAPMPCWVPPALRTVPLLETAPPTFIGSADVIRRALFGRALALGADFFVRGPGWSGNDQVAQSQVNPKSVIKALANQVDLVRSRGLRSLYFKLLDRALPLKNPEVPASRILPPASDAEYAQVIRQAAITIGVNSVPTTYASNRMPLKYSRLRDIEAPMLGACYLTEWTQGLEHLYEIGAEIEAYRTPEELVAKLGALSRDPVRRRRMRERAQQRALADHSVARTLTRIRERLSL